jgi:hypothetical protein
MSGRSGVIQVGLKVLFALLAARSEDSPVFHTMIIAKGCKMCECGVRRQSYWKYFKDTFCGCNNVKVFSGLAADRL